MDGLYFDYDYVDTTGNAASGANDILLYVIIGIVGVIAVAGLVFGLLSFIKYTSLQRIGLSGQNATTNEVGVVFCKKCGNQFAASTPSCPFCGEKR